MKAKKKEIRKAAGPKAEIWWGLWSADLGLIKVLSNRKSILSWKKVIYPKSRLIRFEIRPKAPKPTPNQESK